MSYIRNLVLITLLSLPCITAFIVDKNGTTLSMTGSIAIAAPQSTIQPLPQETQSSSIPERTINGTAPTITSIATFANCQTQTAEPAYGNTTLVLLDAQIISYGSVTLTGGSGNKGLVTVPCAAYHSIYPSSYLPRVTGTCYIDVSGNMTASISSAFTFIRPTSNFASPSATGLLPCARDPLYSMYTSLKTEAVVSWHSFARSPQCTSYAGILQKNRTELGRGVPDDVVNTAGPFAFKMKTITCCGTCTMYATSVQAFFWSTGPSETNCLPTTSLSDRFTGPPPPHYRLRKRTETAPSSFNGSSFDVVDGSTLTFPSVYMAFPGTVYVQDDCGTVGNVHTGVTVAVAPESVSTYSFTDWSINLNGIATGKYDYAACRTYGLTDPETITHHVGASVITRYTQHPGPPYNPMVSPPAALYQYDPEWKKRCSVWADPSEITVELGVFDPPHMLTPRATMAGPSMSVVDPGPQSSLSSLTQALHTFVDPSLSMASHLPETTQKSFDPNQAVHSELDQTMVATQPISLSVSSVSKLSTPDPLAAPFISMIAGTEFHSNPMVTPAPKSASNVPSTYAEPLMPLAVSPGTDSGSSSADPIHSDQSSKDQSNVAGPGAHSLVSLASQKTSATIPGMHIGTQKPAETTKSRFMPNVPSGLTFSRASEPSSGAKEPGMSIGNGALAPFQGSYASDTLDVAANTGTIIATNTNALTSLQNAGTRSHNMILVIKSSTYTANSASEFLIADHTLKPGSMITTGTTSISLDTGVSFAVFGTSTIGVSTNADKGSGTGQLYKVDSASHIIVDGQTLKPGSVITASSTVVSLDSATSYLVIGSSTLGIATKVPVLNNVFTYGGQTHSLDSASHVLIGGKTLAPGSAITVSSTQLSMGPAATDIVIDTAKQGFGEVVMNGFNSAAGSPSNTVVPFTGSSSHFSVVGSISLFIGILFLKVIGRLTIY